MGAAYLAGLAAGYWKSTEDIRKNWSVDRHFEPKISSDQRNSMIHGWKKAVACSKNWARD
jgi:glycerol kinase